MCVCVCLCLSLSLPLSLSFVIRFESQHILHAMTSAGMKMWVAMGEGRGGELGFLTTNERKEEMCLLLREAMKCFRICLHKQFVCLSLGAEKGKNRLKDELCNYCVINEAPKSAFGKCRKTFTGKKKKNLMCCCESRVYLCPCACVQES